MSEVQEIISEMRSSGELAPDPKAGGWAEPGTITEPLSEEASGKPKHPGKGSPQPPQTPTQTPQPTPQAAKEWILNVNGRQIKTSDEAMLLKWAQQGYHFAQQQTDLNKWKSEQENKYKGYDRYQAIDEYAKKNPGWWQSVEQSYQQATQGQPGAQQNVQFLLEQALAPIKEKLSHYEMDKQNQEIQKADGQLRDQIESVRKAYPQLDFTKADQSGKTLEMKVLEHAQMRGIPDFKAAFRDLCFDQILEMERMKAQETVTKDLQAKTKSGLLSQSKGQPPAKANGISFNPRGNYRSDVVEALAELGLAS